MIFGLSSVTETISQPDGRAGRVCVASKRPLHDWHRHHPTAKRIAAELLTQPAILSLRTPRLVADICNIKGVGPCTARTAVAFARRAA